MTRALDPAYLHHEIELLKRQHPEIFDSDDEVFRLDALEGQTSLNEFLAATVTQMLMADAQVRGLKAVLADMRLRSDNFERRIEALRALAYKMMEQAGVRKIELPAATLSIRAGTPKVIVIDEEMLPPQFIRVRREPDRVAIKQAFADGQPVPGAELSNAEPVLAMRVK